MARVFEAAIQKRAGASLAHKISQHKKTVMLRQKTKNPRDLQAISMMTKKVTKSAL